MRLVDGRLMLGASTGRQYPSTGDRLSDFSPDTFVPQWTNPCWLPCLLQRFQAPGRKPWYLQTKRS